MHRRANPSLVSTRGSPRSSGHAKPLASPLTLLATLLVVIAVYTAIPIAKGLEIDAVALLEWVSDGDTVRVIVVKVCDPHLQRLLEGYEGRVRLADINAPELSTISGKAAKLALEALLAGNKTIYLDVDDERVFDRYGRIVAVVLVVAGDRLLNVNEWLLEHGYAEPVDYPNEFHPHWSLYESLDLLTRCRVNSTGEQTATVTVTTTVTVTEYLGVTVTRTQHYTTTVTTIVTETVTKPVTLTLTKTKTEVIIVTSFVKPATGTPPPSTLALILAALLFALALLFIRRYARGA